jgi:recombination protein RecR
MSNSFSPVVNQLIEALSFLPGVGPKSAQRMAFYLLQHHRDRGVQLGQQLQIAMQAVKHCEQCRHFTEQTLCDICQNAKRDQRVICVVETPADLIAIEQTHLFSGRYFVLMGHLSPLDGLGPQELGLDLLQQQLSKGDITEIIIATNPTVEGEATSHFIADMANAKKIKVTRIAHGVPIGGELEYIDNTTLAHAFSGRHEIA